MIDNFARVYRLAIVVVLAVVGTTVGWILFYRAPDTPTDLVGLPLFIGMIVATFCVGDRFATLALPGYDMAEVAVEGSASHDDGGGPVPGCGGGMPVDDIVEQVDAVAGDDSADTLLAKLSAPGGKALPSGDIRRAVADFDRPTVAYVTDACTPGGYWIVNGCDELWSRDVSVVGSTGVIGSLVNALELADKVGLSYKRFTVGKYKDAGTTLREPTEDEHEYLQGFINDYYDDFVERAAKGCDMDSQVVRDTEARVYSGEEAHELDLVDSLGSRDDVGDRLAERLGHDEVPTRKSTPEVGLTNQLRGGVEGATYAFGVGPASSVDPDDGSSFRF